MTLRVVRGDEACMEGCCRVTYDDELLPPSEASGYGEVRPMFQVLNAGWGGAPACWYAEGGPDELSWTGRPDAAVEG